MKAEIQNGNGRGFWSITVSGVLQIVLLIGTSVTFFISYDRSINDTKNITTQNARDIATLTKTVADINERGTAYSHADNIIIANLTERATQHERILAELSPKIERIQTSLEFLRLYVQDYPRKK